MKALRLSALISFSEEGLGWAQLRDRALVDNSTLSKGSVMFNNHGCQT